MNKSINKSEKWYAEKTEWNDDFQASNRLPKWIIKRYDKSLNEDQLKYTELNVICKIQGYDEDANRYKDIILNAVNGEK
jgi:Fe-S-cluster formation regulator IscX/YfhJ